jgi:hypothetical protein
VTSKPLIGNAVYLEVATPLCKLGVIEELGTLLVGVLSIAPPTAMMV